MPVRVLLLDDDLAFATEARAAFAAAGCEVEVHAEGGAAVASASERPPDVVLASAELPGVNGFRLCSRLKKDHPDLAVVLTFAEASISGVASHQRLASRADAYVPRSIALHELVARVRALGGKRARSDSPASSRRRSGSTRPRSKTPGSSRVPGALPRDPAMPRPLPLAPMPAPQAPRGGAAARTAVPRPEPTSATGSEPLALRRVAEAAKAERDEVKRALAAAQTDAQALRRAADAARRDQEAKARELAAVQRDLVALTVELGVVRGERDERGRELSEARARVVRLEQQLVEAERESRGPTSERVDQRLLVLQRSADAARIGREEARAELAAEQARRAALERSLAEEVAAREAAEALRVEAEAQRLLATEADPTTVEARIAEAVERVRREHALEMTRLRGEHAAVVFQHRHELATLRAQVRGPKAPASIGLPRAKLESLVDMDAFAEPSSADPQSLEALRARHEQEMDAMRANLDVAIRRVEMLERQIEATAGSGERPSVGRGDRTRGAG